MEVEVCSLYLFDPQRERVVLRATIGLDRESVGKVSMRRNEGLVGTGPRNDAPVAVADAISHPRYKYFPETGEEKYHSFLGVPLQNGSAQADRCAGGADAAPPQVQPGRNSTVTDRGQPGRANPFALPPARDARDQGTEREEYRRRMIEANRQLKDYEKVGGKTRLVAPAEDSPSPTGRCGRFARIRSWRRARGRHLHEHHRPQSARARPGGRAQTSRRRGWPAPTPSSGRSRRGWPR